MFSKYNEMTSAELAEANTSLNERLIEFRKKIKEVERIIKKPYWWTLAIPIFGLLIFTSLVNKRKANTEYGSELLELKANEMYLELELKYVEKKLSEIT